MMKQIERLVRNVPDFPKPGILFKDITPVLADPLAFRSCIEHFAQHTREKSIDKIVGIESRGFIFAAALALELKKGLVLVRKKGKLPYKTVSVTYDLEYGTDTLQIHEDSILDREGVLIVDDLLATGGTAAATVKLVESCGGIVLECCFLIELAFLEGRKKLMKTPVYAPLKY